MTAIPARYTRQLIDLEEQIAWRERGGHGHAELDWQRARMVKHINLIEAHWVRSVVLCPMCDGFGEVMECESEETVACPACHGSGIAREERDDRACSDRANISNNNGS